MKKYYLLLFIVTLFSLTSCARSIGTQDEILTLKFDITFKQAPNLNDTIYLIVFSSENTISPSTQTSLNEYFFFPGKVFNSTELANLSRDITYYYANYFNTWSKFIYISGSDVELIDSGALFPSSSTDNFIYTQSLNFENILSINNNTLSISADITKLGYLENDTVSVCLLTFNKSNFIESGLFQDISDLTEIISLVKFNQKSLTSLENTFINPQADIIKWDYSIY